MYIKKSRKSATIIGNYTITKNYTFFPTLLQVAEMYCKNMPQYNQKPKLSCTQVDKFDFNRPVWLDKVCDGVCDCWGCEDEGSMGTCKPKADQTALGCCTYLVGQAQQTESCVADATANSRDAYLCPSGLVIYNDSGYWIYGQGEPAGSYAGLGSLLAYTQDQFEKQKSIYILFWTYIKFTKNIMRLRLPIL